MGIWGEDKTCKTTMALTFPKPLILFEFDIGGFDRAKYRFKADIESGAITLKQYPMPLPAIITKKELTLKQSKIVVGMKELWYSFLQDYYANLQNEDIATIVLDTGTVLWEVIANAYLQEKQEQQQEESKPVWEQLIQLQYKEPNSRMRSILYAPKDPSLSKHLVITHHSREQFRNQIGNDGRLVSMSTGEKERAGWGNLGDIADMIVRTYIKKEDNVKVPYCIIQENGLDLRLDGTEIKEPSYNDIMKRLSILRGEE